MKRRRWASTRVRDRCLANGRVLGRRSDGPTTPRVGPVLFCNVELSWTATHSVGQDKSVDRNAQRPLARADRGWWGRAAVGESVTGLLLPPFLFKSKRPLPLSRPCSTTRKSNRRMRFPPATQYPSVRSRYPPPRKSPTRKGKQKKIAPPSETTPKRDAAFRPTRGRRRRGRREARDRRVAPRGVPRGRVRVARAAAPCLPCRWCPAPCALLVRRPRRVRR